MGGRLRIATGAALAAPLCCLFAAAPALGFDASREQRNFAKIQERYAHEGSDPGHQADQLESDAENLTGILRRDAEEGDRFSASLCGSGILTCNGDVRFYDWNGRLGLQVPIIFVNRNGAHVEGHVWISLRTVRSIERERARRARVKRAKEARARLKRRRARAKRARQRRARRRGTARRSPAFTGARRPKTRRKKPKGRPMRVPGVVIETGSVQAPERWYYWAAQVLAAHDYVVMTFDVQGQGRSDLAGSGPDAFGGVPAQDRGNFVDGLVDAIDFFFSSDGAPYRARTASARERQRTEVAAGDATAHNPLHGYLDRRRLGIAGHSLGAAAVSVVQGVDSRVDAAVAWDNLESGAGVRPRVPALGMSADYLITPFPHAGDPDPEGLNGAYADWRRAGVDAMQVNMRGATHFEWSYSPGPLLPATLRGIDVAAWYTTAWFDRYLRRDPKADDRLLTKRWHRDPVDAGIDPPERGNMFSFYFRSRAAFHRLRDGKLARCGDLRHGCAALVARDGVPEKPPYSYREDRG